MVLAVAVLAACGQMGADELLDSANSYLRKGDPKSAVIQLKQALSQDPGHVKARLLLGKVLLETGDPASAILELRKIPQQGQAIDEVQPLLARALLAVKQYQTIVDELGTSDLKDAAAFADLKTTVAVAYASLNKAAAARREIQAALAKVPDFPPALLLEARMAGFEHRDDDAMAMVDKVLALTPKDPQAWFQKGELLILLRRNIPDAMQAFRTALTIQPSHAGARAALIEILIAQQDFKAASEQLAELRKDSRNNLLVKYFDAQLAFANGDMTKAVASIELAQKAAPDEVKVLQLAGTIQLVNGALLQAERSLSKALSIRPDNVAVRRLLAQTQLRMGQPAKALMTLQPLIAGGETNAQTYSLAGEAQLAMGNLDQSRASFETAVKLDPSNSANLVKLALAKQNASGYQATVASLQKIAAADKGTNADLALISVLLQNKDLDGALKSVDAVEAKLPKNPLPHNLRAKIYLMRNDAHAARASFEKALAIDPVFVPAVAGLAALDLLDKNIDAAKKRFEAVLKVDSRNLDALLSMVKLRAAEGAPKSEIAEMLSQAIRLNPAEPAPRLQLIDLQLAEGNYRAAQAAARDANSALPDQADLIDALGRAEMASGETELAIAAFNKLATLESKSTRPFIRLAAVQLRAGKSVAAEQSLHRALALVPNYLPAQQALVKIALAGKRPDAAIAIARTVQAQRPNETTGQDMEAEIQLSRGNAEAAVEVYRRALKNYPVTIMAVKLHTALRGARKTADAESMAGEWMAAHPKDAGFPAYLGDLALVQGQFDMAEKQFRRVVALQPNNAGALNNIAFSMLKQNKPGAAAYAEQALKLSPDSPGVLDTLASTLAAESQLPKALELQRRALALDPENLVLRLNLARLYIQAGDKPAAQAELKTLEKAGERFPAQAEVTRLLKSL
ncbi:XrtA/PEP-CTERM system TPR-repeat protein PrsT [Roseateles sp.]|uniref:XrtA/PEP-CTERM system TPR-repeat protein PrsT n=1 Tax=Roseateles sp. TaxID=1971397 RepID=UPI0025E26F96|nr:XrtA/PEP-CTERM system TPR-repeat protein PrsT [Roseateles sp.]MBV8034012.1 PEP-CTERM system TPR-repeat protein PrsT [Roseateles sp.]